MSEDSTQVCADASIIVKLLVPEDDSSLAVTLWRQWGEADATVWTPGNLALEVLNGVRRAALCGLITWEEASAATDRLAALPVATMPVHELRPNELWGGFVVRFDGLVTPYDAAYLLVAEHHNCEFWTADDSLVRTVADELPWVHSLSEIVNEQT